jgi:disulfide bond formation protein DsbB
MNLTRRETHTLIALGILLFILAFIPQETVTNYQIYILAFVGIPLGFYLALDKERIAKK